MPRPPHSDVSVLSPAVAASGRHALDPAASRSDAPGSRPATPASSAIPQLLATKLFVPVSRSAWVARERLDLQLEQGCSGPLTLVCAGAGFGKTTLVADWLRRSKRTAGWYSLDSQDGDSRRFLRYLIAAAQRASAIAADPLLVELAAVASDPDLIAIEFVNAVAELGDPVTIVLDDLHLVEDAAVHRLLAFLIDAAPPNLALIVTSRVEPPLPLPRLRARGLLTEIRAQQLRFTAGETRVFLRTTMGVDVTETALVKLEVRTEGWPVGLQMAALSLRGRDLGTAEAFIDGFAGSNRYVLDYLMDEVLSGLDDEIRRFVLATSILSRLSAPVVNHVAGTQRGQQILEQLENENLFLVPLDDCRQTFRYHHLFGTLLRHELRNTVPAVQVTRLHQLASEALDVAQDYEPAFLHATQADDWDRAETAYLKQHDLRMLQGEIDRINALLRHFPDDEVRRRPALLFKQLCAHDRVRSWGPIDERIEHVRQALRLTPHAQTEAELDAFAAIVRLKNGHVDGMEHALVKAYESCASRSPLMYNMSLMHLSLLYLADDRREQARSVASRAQAVTRALDEPFYGLWGTWWTAVVDLTAGEIDRAAGTLDGLNAELDRLYGEHRPRNTAMAWASYAQVFYERGDLETAGRWIDRALELMDPLQDPANTCGIVTTHAMAEAFRDPLGPGLVTALNYANRVLEQAGMTYFAARLQVLQLRIALSPRSALDPAPLARAWLASPGVRDSTALVFTGVPFPNSRRGSAQLVLARCLARQGALDEATGLAQRCLEQARDAHREPCVVASNLVLAELALQGGHRDAFDAAIREAVQFGQRQRIAGPFFEHGDDLARAAIGLASREGHLAYAQAVERVMTSAPPVDARRAALVAGRRRTAGGTSGRPAEPTAVLSERELEVMHLVAHGLSNAEVGRKLFVAPSTVKKHLEHVYNKLGVRRRTQAVAKAQSLGLLGTPA
ncbi:MAG: hypothetical protein B7733_15790 [Myxococcales bacterium FL481]|nr:MAG: hypothetical protein B7733_15790 [Myxococcales bacterium FL481]